MSDSEREEGGVLYTDSGYGRANYPNEINLACDE